MSDKEPKAALEPITRVERKVVALLDMIDEQVGVIATIQKTAAEALSKIAVAMVVINEMK